MHDFCGKKNFMIVIPFRGPKNMTRMFWEVEHFRALHYSYCIIKYARRHDYLAVHDHDEIIGFNTKRFKSLSEAIKKTEMLYGKNVPSFRG